jgi:uncharacterized protein YecT (DUF1311 family)
MNIKSCLFATILFVLPICTWAQNADFDEKVVLSYLGFNPFSRDADTALAHDIDKILFDCDGMGKTTVGEIGCYYEAIAATEKKIKIAYRALYKKLDSSDKKTFKITQTKWEAYFNTEKDFLNNTFNHPRSENIYGHGREHAIAYVEWLFKIARQRLIAIRVFSNEIP